MVISLLLVVGAAADCRLEGTTECDAGKLGAVALIDCGAYEAETWGADPPWLTFTVADKFAAEWVCPDRSGVVSIYTTAGSEGSQVWLSHTVTCSGAEASDETGGDTAGDSATDEAKDPCGCATSGGMSHSWLAVSGLAILRRRNAAVRPPRCIGVGDDRQRGPGPDHRGMGGVGPGSAASLTAPVS